MILKRWMDEIKENAFIEWHSKKLLLPFANLYLIVIKHSDFNYIFYRSLYFF